MAVNHTTIPQGSGKQRRGYLLAGLLILGAALFTLLAATGAGTALTRPFGLSESRSDMLLGIITGILFALGAGLFWKTRFFCGPGSDRIDVAHSKQGQILIAITLLTIVFAGFAMAHALHFNGPIEIDFSIEFALLALAVALATTFGVGFASKRYRIAANDELVRHLRWRAAQLGYLLAVTGLCASYLAWLFRAEWVTLALPVALLVAVAAPAIYFVAAERRAAADA
jgi:hypothetical protein